MSLCIYSVGRQEARKAGEKRGRRGRRGKKEGKEGYLDTISFLLPYCTVGGGGGGGKKEEESFGDEGRRAWNDLLFLCWTRKRKRKKTRGRGEEGRLGEGIV